MAIGEVGAEGKIVSDHLAASTMIQFWRCLGEYRVQLVKHLTGKDFAVWTIEASAVPCDLAVVLIIEVDSVGVVGIGGDKQVTVELLFAQVEVDGEVKDEEVVEDTVFAASVG